MEYRKYWISKDRQAEIGSWDVAIPDKQIRRELVGKCGNEREMKEILDGTIMTIKWRE